MDGGTRRRWTTEDVNVKTERALVILEFPVLYIDTYVLPISLSLLGCSPLFQPPFRYCTSAQIMRSL